MEDLLANMRAFSLADQQANSGTCCLNDIYTQITQNFPRLTIKVENDDLQLPAEANTLTIILTHLLENAQQHGAKNVVLTAQHTGEGKSLRIADDGLGISAGNVDKILQPFFTTRRDSGGTGMGLNIVKATVEAIGGELAVVASSNGACFEVKFA